MEKINGNNGKVRFEEKDADMYNIAFCDIQHQQSNYFTADECDFK